MKKVLLLGALSLAIWGKAQKQIPQGTMFVSGQAAYHGEKDNATSIESSSYAFTPSFGYYFAPNWSASLGLGIKGEKTQYNPATSSVTEASATAFVLSPAVTKFWPVSDKLSLSAKIVVPLEFGSHKTSATNIASQEEDYTKWGIKLKPGFDYALTHHWKLTTTIGEFGYASTKFKNADHTKDSYTFGVDFSSISFGVKYIIPAHKK